MRLRGLPGILLLAAILLFALPSGVSFYTDWLWFDQLGYTGLFIRRINAQAVTFGCSCSADKVRQSLSIYSAKDIGTMITDQGTVTADCQFCSAHYEFDPATLGFEATRKADGSAQG